MLFRSLRAAWGAADLEGCYLNRNAEPANQSAVASADLGLAAQTVYGYATIPTMGRIVCLTHVVREDGDAAAAGPWGGSAEAPQSSPWGAPAADAAQGSKPFLPARPPVDLGGTSPPTPGGPWGPRRGD